MIMSKRHQEGIWDTILEFLFDHGLPGAFLINVIINLLKRNFYMQQEIKDGEQTESQQKQEGTERPESASAAVLQ